MTDEVSDYAGAVHRRDVAHLIRWIFIVLIIAALVAVAMDNRDDVPIGYVVGDASAPLWIVVVASAIGGMIIGWLVRHRPRRRV
ncbi:MAG TPA: LapA family protein [Ilumatobacteraceae bacterium]|jgi:uncharacterized integral membrane protein